MTFGEKLRTAREHKGYSQRDMADKIPMNQSNYSKLERNLQEPSLNQLRRLCEILSLDPHYLLGLTPKEEPTPPPTDGRYEALLASLFALLEEEKRK
ncbi:MAG: helix-turn-helix transcriptional regulator [Clostridia bacterium]|nr:helix-turn-helix transcriptional regulator [Clostridia bacterium]